jgi:hypothetical protein
MGRLSMIEIMLTGSMKEISDKYTGTSFVIQYFYRKQQNIVIITGVLSYDKILVY